MGVVNRDDGAQAGRRILVEAKQFVTAVDTDGPHHVVVDFGDPERPWRISVNLGESDGITTMTFVQTLSDDVNTTEVGPGWEFYADRMTAALEGGEMPDWDGDSYQDTLGPHYS